MIRHTNVGKEIDHIAQPPLIQLRTCEVLRENILQPAVRLFNSAHGVVNRRADLLGVRRIRNVLPVRILRNEKDTPLGGVFVDILLKALSFVHKLLMSFIKSIRNVL